MIGWTSDPKSAEMRAAARAVVVIDGDGNVAHTELVSEVANEPNYDAALGAIS